MTGPGAVNWGRIVGVLVVVLIMEMPLALVGVGAYYLARLRGGTTGTATVKECHPTEARASHGYVCTGTWVSDGGVIGVGTVNGAVNADEGKRVDVTIRDGAAYTTSIATPVTLIVLGGGTTMLFGFLVWRGRRTKPSR